MSSHVFVLDRIGGRKYKFHIQESTLLRSFAYDSYFSYFSSMLFTTALRIRREEKSKSFYRLNVLGLELFLASPAAATFLLYGIVMELLSSTFSGFQLLGT